MEQYIKDHLDRTIISKKVVFASDVCSLLNTWRENGHPIRDRFIQIVPQPDGYTFMVFYERGLDFEVDLNC